MYTWQITAVLFVLGLIAGFSFAKFLQARSQERKSKANNQKRG
jgi:hypothetical protein